MRDEVAFATGAIVVLVVVGVFSLGQAVGYQMAQEELNSTTTVNLDEFR